MTAQGDLVLGNSLLTMEGRADPHSCQILGSNRTFCHDHSRQQLSIQRSLFDKTMMLEVPVHPNNLKASVKIISFFIHKYFSEGYFQGGVILHPSLLQTIARQSIKWKENLPERWHYWRWPEYIKIE